MPIFSIIFLFIIAIIFIRYRTSENRFYALFALTVILQIHFFQGYFIKIGANEIWSCESLSLKILAFYSLWLIFSGRARLGRNIYIGVMLCLLFLLGSIAYETFVPFDGLLMPHMEGNTDGGYSWDNLVAGKVAMVGYQPSLQELVGASKTFLYYILVLATFKAFFNLEFFTRSLMSVIKWGKLCIYYGLFEFFLKNAVGQLTFTYDLAGALFGVNRAAIFTEAFSKGGTFYSLQGFTREPSHYVMYLFTIALFMVLAGVCQKRCLEIGVYIKKTFYPFEIILSVLVMFLCGGFSTVWLTCLLLVATVIVYIHSRHLSLLQWISKYQATVFGFMVVGMVLAYAISENDYLNGRLQDALYIVSFLQPGNLDITGLVGVIGAGSEGIGSTISRFGSIAYGLEICMGRPLFGIGPGTLWVHDTLITLWLSYGILALLALYYLLTRSRFGLRYDHVLLVVLLVVGGLPMNINMQGLSLSYIVFAEASAIYLLQPDQLPEQEKRSLLAEHPAKASSKD